MPRPTSRVVLLHGFTQTAASWATVQQALTSDYRVVAVDLPGHGSWSEVRADLPGAAARVGEAAGPATYVGYSLGGRVALHLAVQRPDLVERLVVLGATGGIDDPTERAARREADEALAGALEEGGVEAFLDRWLAQPLFAGLPVEEVTGRGRRDRAENTAAGLAASLRLAGTGTQGPLWDRLGALAMPVLVLAGERDAKFTALGERLAASIGANATFATVPGAGHAAHLEAPERFLLVLRSWLADHPVAPG